MNAEDAECAKDAEMKKARRESSHAVPFECYLPLRGKWLRIFLCFAAVVLLILTVLLVIPLFDQQRY
jgi:hypothetical protein